jgi:hypothetical protein
MEHIQQCKICNGKYPESKHNFEHCYSLDYKWDLKQFKKLNQQTTGLLRNTIDKFYTKPEIVELCISSLSIITIQRHETIIEPSAGDGAFIPGIKSISDNYLFYDIKPEHKEIKTQDFLKIVPTSTSKIHVVGNPPFGRQSSSAIKFIKHACIFAHSISFILPKSFKKQSMMKKFDKYFHLLKTIDLPENSFTVNNIETDVPCIFQIWIKKNIPRIEPKKLSPVNFKFVKKEENPTISFRRVGVNAGNISLDIKNKSKQSHYFIQINLDKVDELKKIQYNHNNTVGPKSISKQELIEQFNKLFI